MEKKSLLAEAIENGGLPRDDLTKQDVLSQIMKESFVLLKEYSDADVRAILSVLFPDEFPTIRRELVNFGYLESNPYDGIFTAIRDELSEAELERLVTWMDTNALFYGTFDPQDQDRQLRGEVIEGPKLQ